MAAQVQTGKASYYSKRITGARTASGQYLHHDSMVCAHRYYPFGTMLKVTNPANNKSVLVKVIDRGPYRRGRIIDLSWAAADALNIIRVGIATVRVQPIRIKGIPFRPDDSDYELPEFEFESTTPYYIPQDIWGKREQSPL